MLDQNVFEDNVTLTCVLGFIILSNYDVLYKSFIILVSTSLMYKNKEVLNFSIN